MLKVGNYIIYSSDNFSNKGKLFPNSKDIVGKAKLEAFKPIYLFIKLLVIG